MPCQSARLPVEPGLRKGTVPEEGMERTGFWGSGVLEHGTGCPLRVRPRICKKSHRLVIWM